MARLAREGSHSYPIRNLATRITHDVPSKDVRGELGAIYRWVRDNVRYRFDPLGLEWVQSPQRTVIERAGDCDDMTTLIASLCGSLGHAWRFRTVGPSPTRQKHVAAEAFDGTQWVALDPVLEPAAATTAPRAELGRFGQHAPGADHLWDDGGNMLRGPTTALDRRLWAGDLGRARARARQRRRRHPMLAGVATARDRELWEWVPYFPQLPPTGGLYPRPDGGTPAVPSLAYRSADAPGPQQSLSGLGAVHVPGSSRFLVPAGALSGSLAGPFHDPNLGWGFLKKIGKAIGKVAKPVVKAAKKAVRVGGKVIKKVGSSTAGKIVMPVLAMNVDPKWKGARDKVANVIPQARALVQAQELATSAAKKFSTGKGQIKLSPELAAQAISAGGVKLPGVKLPAGVKLPGVKLAAGAKPIANIATLAKSLKGKKLPALQLKSADWKAPHPKIAAKYPKNARQLFDNKAGVFHVYVPKAKAKKKAAGVAGLGALRPTITFALGAAAMNAPDFKLHGATFAQLAVDAVAKFIRSRSDKRPPGKVLPEVAEFQRYDAARGAAGFGGTPLSTEGLWGNNSRAAAAWYLGTTPDRLPPTLPALNIAMTWQPPTQAVTAVAPTPAPRPAPVLVAAPAIAPRATTATPVAKLATPKAAPKLKAASKPTAALPTPAGYVQVGTEPNNPGLPPVGYVAPSPAPSSTATITPSAVARMPALVALPSVRSTTAPASSSSPRPAPWRPGAPIVTVDSPRIVDVSTPTPTAPMLAPVLAPMQPPLPAIPVPPLPGDPTSRPSYPITDTRSGSGSTWPLWVALYLLSRSRRPS